MRPLTCIKCFEAYYVNQIVRQPGIGSVGYGMCDKCRDEQYRSMKVHVTVPMVLDLRNLFKANPNATLKDLAPLVSDIVNSTVYTMFNGADQ